MHRHSNHGYRSSEQAKIMWANSQRDRCAAFVWSPSQSHTVN